jgi:septal ring factor EnvC (AmiA/AmiB activator)
MIWLITFALAAFAVVGVARNTAIRDELDEREEALSKYATSLEEKERMLSQWEEELRDSKKDYEEITATYVVTESDLMKYDNDKAIYNRAKDCVSKAIAGDIVRHYAPSWDGMKMVYKFRIK